MVVREVGGWKRAVCVVAVALGPWECLQSIGDFLDLGSWH